jgi:hypothetical protein
LRDQVGDPGSKFEAGWRARRGIHGGVARVASSQSTHATGAAAALHPIVFVDKQVPISPDVGGKPISVADFVVSGTRAVIYVDGAAFHRGAALRRDRYIWQRLVAGNPPWKVVELRAEHLKLGEGLLQMINS